MDGYIRLRFRLSPERKNGRLMLAGVHTVPALRPGVYLCIPRGVGPLKGRALFFTGTRLGTTSAVLCVVGPDLLSRRRRTHASTTHSPYELDCEFGFPQPLTLPELDGSCRTSFDNDPLPTPPDPDPLPGLSASVLRNALQNIADCL